MRTVDPSKWSKKDLDSDLKTVRLGVKEGSLEDRMRSSFLDAMKEYTEQSTLEGVKYASHVETIKPLRHIYIILMLALMVWGSSVLGYFFYDYRTLPRLRVNFVHEAPEEPVPFPAIGVCSNSVVSKKELNQYASFLYKEGKKKLNATYKESKIKENLQKFASLITLRTSDVELLNFMRFLNAIIPNFNITELMYTLSPKCSSMLSMCRWRARLYPCDQVFATRLTPLGFCCLFNSRFQPEDVDTPPKVLDLLGRNYGLTVAVLQDQEDYAVVRQPSTYGLAVLIFDGRDYPLLEGGAVRAYNVGANSSVFFQLSANVQHATVALKNYKFPKNRHECNHMQFEGPRSCKSSRSWCLAECRRRTIASICDCQPFWFRPPESVTVCTPEHLYCLNKHREKFIYYYPMPLRDDMGGLDEELQDSLYCYNCFPDCARVQYTAKVFHPPYFYPKKLFKNAVSSKISLANKSLLRFYYESKIDTVFKVDLNSFWYEEVAALSCQSLFLIGASLVSVAELVYHLTIRWGYHFVKKTREERKQRHMATFH